MMPTLMSFDHKNNPEDGDKEDNAARDGNDDGDNDGDEDADCAGGVSKDGPCRWS